MNSIINNIVSNGTLLFLLLVFLIAKENILNILGGSVAFVFIYLIFSCSLIIKKNILIEHSIVSIITIILLGINFTSYLESEKIYSYGYLIVFVSLLGMLLLFCYFRLNIMIIRDNNEMPEEPLVGEIKKRIIERIVFIPLSGMIVLIFSGFAFIINPNSSIIKQGLVAYTHLAVLCLIFFFALSFLDLKKINKKYLIFIFKTKKRYKISVINRRYIFVFLLLIIFLGSCMELARGYWILWAETLILFVFFISNSWVIWKYFITENDFVEDDIEIEGLKSIRTDVKYLFRYISTFTILFSIYYISLIILFSEF